MRANVPVRSNQPLAGLYAKTSEQQLVFPLKHTCVQAKIAGNLSQVEVTQTFENPLTQPLEAIYLFPLPDEAAVDEMNIKIGDRILKSSIKKREDAQSIYEQAHQEGRTAGLLEQERDNIFTQSLANIKPGETITATIRYTESLTFFDGDCEFVFPMVVGVRFIPGIPIDKSGDTDRVADASRLTAPIIPPSTCSRHYISVTVEIDGGVPISEVHSPSHSIKIERDGQIVRVKLDEGSTIPNKDLILRYRIATDRTTATLLTQTDEQGGHFAAYLIPALTYPTDEIIPKDVVFLIDTSGSQMGDPLRKSQELMRQFINGLNPNDTFTIIDFADIATQLSPKPLPNTPQNRLEAINYINQLRGNGGTYLLNGIRAVLNFPAAAEGRLRSIVLLTDGYIGNENEILAEVQQHLQPGNRLYSFGVGSSPNRFLLNRLAEIGRGTAQIVRQNEPSQEVATRFLQHINNPVLTDIQVTWDGSGEAIIYPVTPPDLFAQQPLVLFGRIFPINTGTLRITGRAAGGHFYDQVFSLAFEDTGNPAIAKLWGRARIKDLMNQMFRCETKAGVDAVTQTALTYQLLSPYTAFGVVSEEVKLDSEGNCLSVRVPVEMPEGVRYEGIFGGTSLSGSTLYTQSTNYVNPSNGSSGKSLRSLRPALRSSINTVKAVNDRWVPLHTDESGKLNLILKADVQSSVEMIVEAIAQLPQTEIRRRVLLAQAGAISQADVDLAAATGAAIVGFNTICAGEIRLAANQAGVELRQYNLIDNFFADIQANLSPVTPTPSHPQLYVKNVAGLDNIAMIDMVRHLQPLILPSGLKGEMVFEFPVRKGRVVRVMLDEDASTLNEATLIDLIKRSLLSWWVPLSVSDTVRMTLCIQSEQGE
ncbi:VIT domain-containing protein [Coleofasciculus sp. LEGE 07092]|uniref:VIT domain-containing protein n=1 Tax=Coleofasciculus sp. LEGE 07092 TaxID=2777969 RepID=UPI00187F6FEC|nr:VIT domain-containing protein [Coleofasciculus sp. LEGE 07092]MBE9148709.1 after-VIT domain-containing protein [Coleofasciculus sp. LEGE 07092]